MKNVARSLIMIGVGCLLTSPSQAMSERQPTDALVQDLVLMEKWWQGEYNNFAEILAADQAETDEGPNQTHYIYKLATIPAFDRPVLYVEQAYGAGDEIDMVYRQRIYINVADAYRNELVTTIYSFNSDEQAQMARGAWREPEKLRDITLADLTPLPKGCEIFWNRVGEAFVGYQNYGVCRMPLPGTDMEIYLEDDLVLTDSGFTTFTRGWTVEGKDMLFGETSPHLRPKARRFTCQVGDQDDAFSLHDQGSEAQWKGPAGSATLKLFAPEPYGDSVELHVNINGSFRSVHSARLGDGLTFTPPLGQVTCALAPPI